MTTIAGDDADDDPRRVATRLIHGSSSPSENWDDDFEFQAGAVTHARSDGNDAMNAPTRPGHSHEQEESWDDAYEDEDTHASPVKRAPKVDDDDVEDWDSSDNELETNDGHNHSNRRDQAPEFGLGGFEEEDKTVTARSTSSRPRDPPPALPLPIPSSHPTLPFQTHTVLPSSTTSPTLSTFSIPLSSTTRDRASIYSQDPLMPSSNSSAPHLSVMRSYPHAAGSTPPRKGRRLRKKSRPPEADIFELEDREPDPVPAPVAAPANVPHPDTPPPTTPPHAQQTTFESPSRASQPSAPPTPSPSLLTRIGSLKRWARRSMGPDDPALSGWRRAKSSTGPSEGKGSHGPNDVIARGGKSSTGPEDLAFVEENFELNARTVSPTPAPGSRARRSRGDSASGQKSGWFFRAGGGAGLEREEVSPLSQATKLSPSKRGTTLGLRRRNKEPSEVDGDGEGEAGTPTPRKAKGKLIPTLKVGGSPGFQKQVQPTSPTRASRRPKSRDGPDSQLHHGSRPMSMLFPRHGSASVGRNSGVPLSVSISAGVALSNSGGDEQEKGGKTHGEGRERESGVRGLMNGVRRLSLVGAGHAHKRTKSTGGDVTIVEAVRKDVVGRPRSRTEQHSSSKTEQSAVAVQVPATRTGALNGEVAGLLPSIDLESPLSGQFARRGSSPWADYDPCSTAMGGPSAVSAYRPPSNLLPGWQQQQPQSRQSFSTSASSLLAGSPAKSSRSGSPTRPARSSTVPIPVPALPSDTLPRSRSVSPAAHPEQRSTSHSQLPAATSSSLPSISQPQLPSHAPASPAPHSASLGRSTTSPSHSVGLRRNSLGDLKMPMNTLGEHKAQLPPLGELKIPARISRAQQGLRRDLGMVREFAGCVEQLKRLQATYTALLGDLRAAYEASPVSPAPAAAQVQFHLPSRPPSQTGIARKTITCNSNPSVQSVQQTMSLNSPTQLHPARSFSRASQDISRELVRLEHEYGIWWECAELLVELGGGSGAATGAASNPNLTAHSASTVNTPAEEPYKELSPRDEQPVFLRPTTHVSSMSEPGSIFEHALPTTSSSKSPPQASPPHPTQWRASTGRHDLSARQLRLLKDMLSTPDPASLAYAAGPYGYGAGYPQPHSHPPPYAVAEARPWAAWNPSAVTLPSEESSADTHGHGAGTASVGRSDGKEKRRRASRLGMLGLREILRGLKRNAVAEGRLGANGEQTHGQQGSESSVSNSAEDDHYNRRRSPWHQHDEHHVAKQSTGPEDVTAKIDHPPTRTAIPKSPRRPSLASIFRIGQKGTKSTNSNGKNKDVATSGNGSSTTEDEREPDSAVGAVGEYSDWERMSRSDLDLNANVIGSGTATVRGKKLTKPSASHSSTNIQYTYSNDNATTPKKTPATSQTSLWDSSPPSATSPQPSRLPLSIAEEEGGLHTQKSKTPVQARSKKERTSSWSQAHPPRPESRNGKAVMSGTVRSAPPTGISSTPDPKLALTPENIKPLLEYAKEVSTRLAECIGEVQTLLGVSAGGRA